VLPISNSYYHLTIVSLLQACTNGEDPIGLVQQAARDHIPVNPKDRKREDSPVKNVPDVSTRPSILEVIEEIRKEGWYHNQIVEQRSFEAREAEYGVSLNHLCAPLGHHRRVTQGTSQHHFLAISRRG
jgi:DEAD/DEAH box helicase domain-containing protein